MTWHFVIRDSVSIEDQEKCDGGLDRCPVGFPTYDAQGIYLCTLCPKCRAAKLARYKPHILTGYTQADVDEPIEPED